MTEVIKLNAVTDSDIMEVKYNDDVHDIRKDLTKQVTKLLFATGISFNHLPPTIQSVLQTPHKDNAKYKAFAAVTTWKHNSKTTEPKQVAMIPGKSECRKTQQTPSKRGFG